MVTILQDQEIDLDRRDRQSFKRSYRWLVNHGHHIQSEDQATSLAISASIQGQYAVSNHAQTVADLWDLTE